MRPLETLVNNRNHCRAENLPGGFSRSSNSSRPASVVCWLLALLVVIAVAGCGDDTFAPSPAEDRVTSATWLNPLPTVRTFYEVAAVGPEHFLAVGPGGMLWREGDTWRPENLDDVTMYSVWGSSPSDVFVGAEDGLIYHFDGASWSREDTGVGVAIESLHGSGPNDVWAGGRSFLYYDGSAWSLVEPQIGGIMGIWAASPTSVFVLSFSGVYQFDGSQWTQTLSDSVLGPRHGGVTTNYFTDIWGRSSSDVYALASEGALFHFDGESWSEGKVSEVSGNEAVSIDGGPDGDMWITQAFGPMLRGDGLTWTPVLDASNNNVYKVAISSAGEGVAVGLGGHYFQLEGDEWRPGWSGFLGYEYSLEAITPLDGGLACFCVRASSYLQLRGAAVTAEPFDTLRVRDAWSPNGDDVFVVGANGAVRRRTAGQWHADATGVDAPLSAVHGSSPTDVWAVGEQGTILHFDGAVWTPFAAPTSADLIDVVSVRRTLAYALPDGPGLLLEFDGESWRRVEDARIYDLLALWAADGSTTIGVGRGGRIVRLREGAFDLEMQSGVSNDLLAVHGNARGNVIAVGGGTIVRLIGDRWERVNARTGYALTDTWVRDDGTAIVVGERGVILEVPQPGAL